MKICVLGLDCAAPEVIFGDERLINIRRLMEAGVYGRLESIVPPITVPAWMSMCTSQDPGSLGVYGFRNRSDYSYDKLHLVNSASIKALAIWDHLAREGKKSIIMGVPPNYPPRKINGISIGCFLTPDPVQNEFTWPAGIKQEINRLVGEYPVDVKGFRTDDKAWLRGQIFEMSRRHWEVVRWLIREKEWDYFHYVDIGLDRVHHGFWNFFDKQHVDYEAGNPYESVVPDYYLWLDEQIGSVLELLDQDTMVLLVSDHGAQRLDGGFAVNEWLIREGLLVLNTYPGRVTQFSDLDVNWGKTRVWSEGGYYARVFFNVEGREPNGTIKQSDAAALQNEMQVKLESLCDAKGASLNSLVFKPEEIYRTVKNVAPDLIVHFGGLYWRSIGSVGHKQVHVKENDTGPDGCNHAQQGMFILAAPNCPMQGEYTGAHLLDIAPTLLDLADSEIPDTMQGRALFAGLERKPRNPDESAGYDKIIHDRLAGLGYV